MQAMPDTTATAAAGPDDLSLVLFGLPGAGKSSLLEALRQAAVPRAESVA